MILTVFLQSSSDVVNILSIKEVSVIGLLLLIIVYLVWQQGKIDGKHDAEKAELKAQINEAHERLNQEYQTSTSDIKAMIENYYTISTKVLEALNNKL